LQTEITNTLARTVADLNVSTEKTLRIVYQPAANFRVKAETRCSSALGGREYTNNPTLLVMSVSFSSSFLRDCLRLQTRSP
jgi:hypothetical protein